jgi:hypothetical protein
MADLEGIVQGEFGKTIVLTLKNAAGVVQNLSTYGGTNTLVFRPPMNLGAPITVQSSFTSDLGSDGKLEFQFSSTAPPNYAGEWEGQAELNDSGGAKLGKSYPFTMYVERALREIP